MFYESLSHHTIFSVAFNIESIVFLILLFAFGNHFIQLYIHVISGQQQNLLVNLTQQKLN